MPTPNRSPASGSPTCCRPPPALRLRWALTLPAVQPPPYLIPVTYHTPLRPTIYYAFWKQAFFLSSALRLPHSGLKRALLCTLGLTRHLLPCPAAPPLRPLHLPLQLRPGAFLTCLCCCGPRPAASFSASFWSSFGLGASDIRNPGARSLANPWCVTDCPPRCYRNWKNYSRTMRLRLLPVAADLLPPP